MMRLSMTRIAVTNDIGDTSSICAVQSLGTYDTESRLAVASMSLIRCSATNWPISPVPT